MRPLQPIAHPSIALLALSVMPLHALPTTSLSATRPRQVTPAAPHLPDEAAAVLQSLRKDVAQHPAAYVTFETETAAHRFFLEHPDAFRETDHTMMTRGIVGYWRGRTLAVLPTLPRPNLFHSAL